jgi:hypothetical protein
MHDLKRHTLQENPGVPNFQVLPHLHFLINAEQPRYKSDQHLLKLHGNSF